MERRSPSSQSRAHRLQSRHDPPRPPRSADRAGQERVDPPEQPAIQRLVQRRDRVVDTAPARYSGHERSLERSSVEPQRPMTVRGAAGQDAEATHVLSGSVHTRRRRVIDSQRREHLRDAKNGPLIRESEPELIVLDSEPLWPLVELQSSSETAVNKHRRSPDRRGSEDCRARNPTSPPRDAASRCRLLCPENSERRAAAHGGRSAAHCLDLAQEFFGMPQVVVVEEGDEIFARGGKPDVSLRCDWVLGRRRVVRQRDAGAGKTAKQLPDPGAIAVDEVDPNDPWVTLRRYRGERLEGLSDPRVVRNDHSNRGPIPPISSVAYEHEEEPLAGTTVTWPPTLRTRRWSASGPRRAEPDHTQDRVPEAPSCRLASRAHRLSGERRVDERARGQTRPRAAR